MKQLAGKVRVHATRKAVVAGHHAKRIAKKYYKTDPNAHTKPFRKRHVGSLGILLLLSFVLVSGITAYYAANREQRNGAAQAAQSINPLQTATNAVLLHSQLGFSFVFDMRQYHVEATAVQPDGDLQTYGGSDLSQPRNYSIVQVSIPQKEGGKVDPSQLTILSDAAELDVAGLKRRFGEMDEGHLIAKQYEDVTGSEFTIIRAAESSEIINNQSWLKVTYLNTPKIQSKGASLQLATTKTTLYVAYAYSRAYVVKISGITEELTPDSAYSGIIESLTITTPKVASQANAIDPLDAAKNITPFRPQSFAERLLGLERASAADDTTLKNQRELLVARYTPATVRLYHVVCGDILYNGRPLSSQCDGGLGTGFIVSSDGYIATNGHVVSTSVKDIVANNIMYSTTLLEGMLGIEGYSKTDIADIIADIKDDPSQISTIAAAVYQLKDGILELKNEKHFYLVSLGNDQPDLDKIVKTKQGPSDSTTIKNAKFIAADYSVDDLVSGNFTHSDVALLKMEGGSFPIVSLGSIDTLVNGAQLTVIGFPAAAENLIIDSTKLKATATSGVVSAIRNANDGQKRLVQSDVKIGHGNSGGPTFDERGKVVGLATYTYASEESGDGNITYIRDIKDLLDLAKSKNITFKTDSSTEKLWEDGLNSFFGAHYTKAIDKFKEVQKIYPAHSLAAEYISIAQAKIKNGEEARSPWALVWMVCGLVLVLFGVGLAILLIVQHHTKHKLFITGHFASAFSALPFPHIAAPAPAVAAAMPMARSAVAAHPVAPVTEPVPRLTTAVGSAAIRASRSRHITRATRQH